MAKIEPYKGIAELYEEVRPSYPEQLIQDIINRTELKQEALLLEIGAGTGKATVQFAERGFTVHANEIGEDMASILRDKCSCYPKVSVGVMPFESMAAPEGTYDMIYSAQAFHWIDKEIKYKKCSALLRENGYLVLFWYKPCDSLPETKEMEEEINRIVTGYVENYYTETGTSERRSHDGVSDHDERKAEIEASGFFELLDKREYTMEIKNSPSQYLKAMQSVPAFATLLDGMEDSVLDQMNQEILEVIHKYGGYSRTLFHFTLYIARKK